VAPAGRARLVAARAIWAVLQLPRGDRRLVVGLFMLVCRWSRRKAIRACAARARRHRADHGALSEVATTATGLVSGAGNYWDAAQPEWPSSSASASALLRRMVEAKAILQENRQLKARLQLRERSRERSPRARRRLLVQSPRRFAILSVGTSDGVAIGMPVRAPTG
jgi:rod shape-determining protein MreC